MYNYPVHACAACKTAGTLSKAPTHCTPANIKQGSYPLHASKHQARLLPTACQQTSSKAPPTVRQQTSSKAPPLHASKHQARLLPTACQQTSSKAPTHCTPGNVHVKQGSSNPLHASKRPRQARLLPMATARQAQIALHIRNNCNAEGNSFCHNPGCLGSYTAYRVNVWGLRNPGANRRVKKRHVPNKQTITEHICCMTCSWQYLCDYQHFHSTTQVHSPSEDKPLILACPPMQHLTDNGQY